VGGVPSTTSRTPRALATERALTAAARSVFARQGYAGARVEDVVGQAGVSHGTFYTYFENKSAVLRRLVEESADRLLAVAAAPWEGQDVEDALIDVIGSILEVFADEADVIRVWLEAAASEPSFAAMLRDVRANFAARVADDLRPALEGTGHDARVAAAALVGMVEGYATERYPGATVAERDEAVVTLAALWAGALQRLSPERA
jgi:AcrR family transcriptional regulator